MIRIVMLRLACSGLLGLVAVPVCADVVINPTHFGASFDVGQIVKGKVGNDADIPVEKEPITRTGAGLGMSATMDGKLDINIGIGGLFWYALPQPNARDKLLLFGSGAGQAEGVYRFGDAEKPSAILHMGLFDHKYNPDSKNLGEYLFRSGTYPAYVWTGGWSYVNSASYLAQGFRLTLPTFGGKVVHDFALYMERDIAPKHDLSPAYLITVKPGSALEFGAGLVWSNGLSLRQDDAVTPEVRVNAYVKSTKLPLIGQEWDRHGYELNDPRVRADGDSCLIYGSSCYDPSFVSITDNGVPNSALAYYTFRGFKAMARASADLGLMMGMAKDAFKVYGEWAWLGIKNQPYYYDKPSERMPVMAGVNIPNFGLFDVLSVEVDYRKSQFPNSIAMEWSRRIPVPIRAAGDNPLLYRPEGRAYFLANALDTTGYAAQVAQIDKAAKDNALHWSIIAKRKIYQGLSLTAQVASDHQRHFYIVFGQPGGPPATQRTQDWYYVLRLEFGI